MLKSKKIKGLDSPVVYGSDDEMRNWAITVLANHITTTEIALPSQAYEVFERLINGKFTETPVKALARDLVDIDNRVNHLETNTGVQVFGQTEKKLARTR